MSKKKLSVLWIIYFFIYLILSIGALVDILTNKNAGMFEYLDAAVSIPSLVALAGWAWRRKMLNQLVWVVFAILFIGFDIIYNIFLANTDFKARLDAGTMIGLILELPAYAATILYAKKWKEL